MATQTVPMVRMKKENCVQGQILMLIKYIGAILTKQFYGRWQCREGSVRCENSNVCVDQPHVSLCSGTIQWQIIKNRQYILLFTT